MITKYLRKCRPLGQEITPLSVKGNNPYLDFML